MSKIKPADMSEQDLERIRQKIDEVGEDYASYRALSPLSKKYQVKAAVAVEKKPRTALRLVLRGRS